MEHSLAARWGMPYLIRPYRPSPLPPPPPRAHQLPPGLLIQVLLQALQVVCLCIPLVVPAQRPHEDDGDQAGEEHDHHEGVDDGEPVDLAAQRSMGAQHGQVRRAHVMGAQHGQVRRARVMGAQHGQVRRAGHAAWGHSMGR